MPTYVLHIPETDTVHLFLKQCFHDLHLSKTRYSDQPNNRAANLIIFLEKNTYTTLLGHTRLLISEIFPSKLCIHLLTIVVDCEWGNWQECSTTCGSGIQFRKKKVKARFGGRPCSGRKTRRCNQNVKCFGKLCLLRWIRKDFVIHSQKKLYYQNFFETRSKSLLYYLSLLFQKTL